MPKDNTSTIVAPSTPAGFGGIGVVRLSGPQSHRIASAITGQTLRPRYAHYADFCDAAGTPIDSGIALYFAAPKSYTGEDMLELQAHGSPQVIDMLLARCLALGARTARPGEFTERAFLNGKLDLSQAESVIDLIQARSQGAARAAQRSLRGAFSQCVAELVAQLVSVRVWLEASLDFSEDHPDLPTDGILQERVRALRALSQTVFQLAGRGQLLRDGVTVVLGGPANAGKSTLFNHLLGTDRALVSELAGTTRDVLHAQIAIEGLPIELIDTAGLRVTEDRLESDGIARAQGEIGNADRVLYVCDFECEHAPLEEMPQLNCPVDVVVNKIDRCDVAPAIEHTQTGTRIYLSAKTGEGVDLLRHHLAHAFGVADNSATNMIARQRHLEALRSASEHVELGLEQLARGADIELVVEDFIAAQRALESITGAYSSDDLLGDIFSRFCIGK